MTQGKTKRVRTRAIIDAMCAGGRPTRPTEDAKFANIYRALLKAGLTDRQAFAIVRDAYDAERGYEWLLVQGSPLHRATQEVQAERHPNGKCAEDLRAAHEGRASRWGSREFHSEAGDLIAERTDAAVQP